MLAQKNTLANLAHEWLSEGINPLPLKKDKSPLLPVGHSFYSTFIDQIDDRFKKAEMIGIALGKVSDGLYCLDFDCHDGEPIDNPYQEFMKAGIIQSLLGEGKLSITKTRGGGYHCYFKSESDHLKKTVFARWDTGKVMCELLANGQYVVTAPSLGYTHIEGCEIIKLDRMSTTEYGLMVSLCMSLSQAPPNEEAQTTNSGKKRVWPTKWDDKTPDGNFNNNNAEVAKTLLKEAGWKHLNTRRDGVEIWQRPGKSERDGISATFGARFNMFYNFSANGAPFKADTAYTPFEIYTHLKFNGDWKTAKKSLKQPIIIKEEDFVETPKSQLSFPLHTLHPFIQDYVNELSKSLNFNPDFSAISALFTIATINGNKVKLKVKNGWVAPSIFWFAVVGHPGTIKTHPVKTLIQPLFEMDRISKQNFDAEIAHYNPDAQPRQPRPKFYQTLISDYTLEALNSIHTINKRGVGLYKDELVGFLKDMNKYRKGSDEQFWLESFNNGGHIVNRATKDPVLLENICINIIGTIQHDVLNEVVNTYKGNGLIDRFLFTASENKVYPLTDQEVADTYSATWATVLKKMNQQWLYGERKDTDIIKMTPEAFKAYQDIDAAFVQRQNSGDEAIEIKNYLSKMKTYIPRFALLLTVMDSIFDDTYMMVETKHIVNAGLIADYFIKTATDVFSDNQERKDIAIVEANMRGLKRDERIVELYRRDFPTTAMAKYFGLSRMQIHRIIKKAGDATQKPSVT